MSEVPKDDSTLTVRADRDLLERFRIVAIRKRKSMSEIIRDFMVWYIEKEEQPRERV